MQSMPVDCVLVGDGGVGKTCMLISFTQDHFPMEYVPTLFDIYNHPMTVDGQSVTLSTNKLIYYSIKKPFHSGIIPTNLEESQLVRKTFKGSDKSFSQSYTVVEQLYILINPAIKPSIFSDKSSKLPFFTIY